MNTPSIPEALSHHTGGSGEIRILFYTHSSRAFTSTLVGHLHEIACAFPVVLIAEPLPPDYLLLLQDRTLFPHLEKIIPVQCLEYTLGQLIKNNRRWHTLAQNLIKENHPTILVTENDMASLFEMYLLRAAKKSGAATLTIQAMANFKEQDNMKWVELLHLHPQGEAANPVLKWLRWMRMKARKEFGHLLVHTLLPWQAGEHSLRGGSSYIRYRGASGMRDGDLNLVLTPETYHEFRERGVPPHKLSVLRHPLERSIPRQLYWRDIGLAPGPTSTATQKRILVLLGFVTAGFTKYLHLPYPAAERKQIFNRILLMVCRLLPDWQVLLKAHPNWKTKEAVTSFLRPVPSNICVIGPTEPVEPLFGSCDAILDMPPAATTVLFTVSRAFPQKPVIAADVSAEFYGDNYRDFPGIDYVDSWDALEQLLQRVRNGTFGKTFAKAAETTKAPEFTSSVEAINTLVRTKGHSVPSGNCV